MVSIVCHIVTPPPVSQGVGGHGIAYKASLHIGLGEIDLIV